MRDKKLFGIWWSAITEAGFIVGILATAAQLSGVSSVALAIWFLVVLALLSITFFNAKLFHLRRTYFQKVELVIGHANTFRKLTELVKNAKESIWVTRFSKGSIRPEYEYFEWTKRRVLGMGCKRLYDYRRITK
jgi:Na+/H+-dicarboxylate symporter